MEEIEIISDSTYVVNAINDNWISNWKSNDFKNKQGEKIKNEDLWRKLYDQLEVLNFIKIKTVFTKIRGHSGNYFNEMVDKLAVKDYVADIIGEKYIIPTINTWNCVDNIDFQSLPNKFVLK